MSLAQLSELDRRWLAFCLADRAYKLASAWDGAVSIQLPRERRDAMAAYVGYAERIGVHTCSPRC